MKGASAIQSVARYGSRRLQRSVSSDFMNRIEMYWSSATPMRRTPSSTALLSSSSASRHERYYSASSPSRRISDNCAHYSSKAADSSSDSSVSSKLLSRLQWVISATSTRVSEGQAKNLSDKGGDTTNQSEEPKIELRRLLQVARSEQRLIAAAMIAQTISAGATMLFPLALGQFHSSVLTLMR